MDSDYDYQSTYSETRYRDNGIYSDYERAGIGGRSSEIRIDIPHMKYSGMGGSIVYGAMHIGIWDENSSNIFRWRTGGFSNTITSGLFTGDTTVIGENLLIGSSVGDIRMRTDYDNLVEISNRNGSAKFGSQTGNYFNFQTGVSNGFYFNNAVTINSTLKVGSTVSATLVHDKGYFDIHSFNTSSHGTGYIRSYYSPSSGRRWQVSGRTSSGASVGVDLYLSSSGEVTASSFNNSSSEKFKHGIEEADTAYISSIVEGLKINNYRYNDKPSRVKIGLVLEQLDEDAGYYLIKGNGESIDMYTLVNMVTATVQEQGKKIRKLENRVRELENLE